MRRWLKIAAWTGGGIAALAALLALASMLVTRTARFQNFVRTKIVSVTEESTGGRVEIGSFEFHWQGLEATMTNFVLHGSEPAGAAPLFRAAKIETRLKLLAGFKKFVDLEYLGIDRPEANVMVFADGSTNVPRPNNVKPGEPALQTVVDLAIHKFEVANGGFTFAERRMPLQARGENLRAVLGYRAIPASYSGNLHIGALRVAQGNGEAIEASFDAPVEIGKDRVEVKGARLATEESQIIFDASVANMASPEIAAHAMAHVALKQVERAAKIAMHPCEKNAPCFADADIDARTEGSWLRISSAKLSIGKSRLEAAGTNGNLLISSTIQMDEIARLFGEQLPAMTARFDGGASIRGLSGVSLKGSVSAPLAPEWGYGGAAGGTISASANLKARGTVGIRATAAIAIAPGKEGVPVSGRIHADYDGASNTVRFANSELGLPHSHLAFSGTLGHTLEATLESTNLRDFEPALKMMKNSPEKLPVELNGGRVALTAQIDGPIARPQIGGHLDVDRFSIENRRFDRMSADFSASAASASVRNATLARRSLSAAFAGSIGLRDWAASEASPVDAAFELRNGDIADALALAGEADIPAKGALTASARIQGTIGNPLGSIHVAAANGVAYDQPFDQADAQVELADGLIRLASLDVSQGAGRIRANGTYSHPRDSLMGGHAEIHVAGNGIELGEIAALKKQRPGLAGSIQMNASASADIREIAGKTDAVLANAAGDVTAHGLHEDRKAYGDVTAHVETSGASVKFRVDSNLAGGAIRIDGGAKLPSMEARAIAKSDPQKDFPLTAKVTVSNLPIESALALADQTLAARGILALTGSFAGTIADPAGDARIDLTRGAIYDEPIDSVQGDVRFASQSVEVSNLRAASAAGNATLNGRFTHPANRFDEGRFEGRVESAGLRIARIHFVQAQKPGIDGTIKLNFDAAGDLHGREVTLSKLDGNGSANAIAFNGHGYGDATLAASTRNGIATIRADSDFAGAAIHADGEARLERDLPVNGKLTIANLRYSNVRGLLGGDEAARPDSDVLFEAQATVNGAAMHPSDLTGRIEVSRLELTTGNTNMAIKNDGVMAANFDHSTLRIERAHLTGRSTDINVTGTAALTGTNPLNLSAKATTDLNLLEQVDRQIHASGSISIDATLRGTMTRPLMNGTVQMKNASINLESVPNGISNANGTIALVGSTARIENFTAQSGGGTITLAGFGSLTGSSLRYTLRADASHVRTRHEGVSVTNTANLTISGGTDRGVISGSVTIERVGFTPESDIGALLDELRGVTMPKAIEGITGPAAAMRLDVHIRTSPTVRFQTTFAQTLDGQADLNLTGTLRQPGMVGRVTITQGDLIFFGNEYTVDRGTIAFYNPLAIDPRVNISLATTVENINVTLGVSGPMNNLKLTYVSDPPLRFDEIVGLLAMGQRPSSDPNIVASQSATPQQSIGQMGASALINQTISSPLASRLQRVFGVSQLRVDPSFINGSALPSARVTLQQRVSNTITFTYSQDLSVSNSELIRVEYSISPRFSAVATRDENGIFGIDFYYKRQFR